MLITISIRGLLGYLQNTLVSDKILGLLRVLALMLVWRAPDNHSSQVYLLCARLGGLYYFSGSWVGRWPGTNAGSAFLGHLQHVKLLCEWAAIG